MCYQGQEAQEVQYSKGCHKDEEAVFFMCTPPPQCRLVQVPPLEGTLFS